MKFSQGILDNSKNTNQALAAAQVELSKIQDKKQTTESKLPEIKETVERAGQEKKAAFDRFLIDECTEKAVDDAQRKFDEAKRTEERTQEILTALAEKEKSLEGQIHRLNEKQGHANGILWDELSNQVMAQISKEISEKVYYAFAVNLRKGFSMPWENFLFSLFARPDSETLKDYAGKLDKLFQRETEGN